MPRYVCLLRGVNVGGHAKLPMNTLRDVIESLGHTEVQTHIQSGNVVFSSVRRVTSASIESALRQQTGLDGTVILRTKDEWERIVAATPFSAANPTSVHVGFMSRKPAVSAVRELETSRFVPEEVAVEGLELYFHLPNGMGQSKLPAYVARRLGVPTTIRNWNTVRKLLELARGSNTEKGRSK